MASLPRRLAALVSLLAALTVCAACAASGPAASASSATAAPPLAGSSSTGPAAGSSAASASVAAHVSKLLVVVLENHSKQQALAQMPFLAAQADRYGVASHWYAVAHPSLPNYLELAGGSTFGVADDKEPAAHRLKGTSVFGQLTAHGHSAATYAESMPTPCSQTNSGRYAARHNPAAYFVDPRERAACRRHDLPAGTTASGPLHDAVVAGRLPTYSLLIPDTCNDGHDCPLATADGWLHRWLPFIENGADFSRGRLAVVVTFDEDDHHAGNHVLTVVAAARLHHKIVTRRFTHSSLAAAPSRLVGLPPLRHGAGSPDVLRAFGLR